MTSREAFEIKILLHNESWRLERFGDHVIASLAVELWSPHPGDEKYCSFSVLNTFSLQHVYRPAKWRTNLIKAYENSYGCGGGGSTKKNHNKHLFSLFGICLKASSKNLKLVKFRTEARHTLLILRKVNFWSKPSRIFKFKRTCLWVWFIMHLMYLDRFDIYLGQRRSYCRETLWSWGFF